MSGPHPSHADSASVVHVVDDDASIREIFTWLMQSNGIPVAAYASAREFLERAPLLEGGCLVLDLHLPGMGGLELQQHLIDRGIAMPVVFLSGRADVPHAVAAVKQGAVDFIEKPFDYRAIVPLIRQCLARDAARRARTVGESDKVRRFSTLTQREIEVLNLVVAGGTNRAIAERLSISVKTVEAHRAHLMEKLGATSIAELVQIALLRARSDPP